MKLIDRIDNEFEVKFTNVNHDTIRRALGRCGAKVWKEERLMRRAVYGGEENPNMVCTYGRIRDEGDVTTLSAKFSAVDGDLTTQREAVVTVDDFSRAQDILESFGLVQTDYQENRRETWRHRNSGLIELEQWPRGLPDYIEIEALNESDVRTISDELGLDWETHTTEPTDQLYATHFGFDQNQLREFMKDLRF